MKISVELSNYPLTENFKPPIRDFIKRLQSHDELTVVCNTMSTQVFGEFDVLMPILNEEIKRSFEQFGKQIFVCKYMNADRTP